VSRQRGDVALAFSINGVISRGALFLARLQRCIAWLALGINMAAALYKRNVWWRTCSLRHFRRIRH